jgi:hypothetical protein
MTSVAIGPSPSQFTFSICIALPLGAQSKISTPSAKDPDAVNTHIHHIEASAADMPMGQNEPPLRLDLQKVMQLYKLPGLSIAVIDNFQIQNTLLHGLEHVNDETIAVAGTIGAMAEGSAIATRVGGMRWVAVASPDYLARHGTPRVPADVSGHSVVAFAGMFGAERWIFRDRARETSVAIKPRLTVSTAEAAVVERFGKFKHRRGPTLQRARQCP